MIDIRDHGGSYGGGSKNIISQWGTKNYLVNAGEVVVANDPIETIFIDKVRKSQRLNVAQYPNQYVIINPYKNGTNYAIKALDSTRAILMWYAESSYYPMAAVLTVSVTANTITMSTPVTLYSAGQFGAPQICVLSPTKVVMISRSYTGALAYAVVVNISGNAIGTVGPPLQWNGSQNSQMFTVAAIDSDNLLVFFRQANVNTQACVMTVSGNTITVNTLYAGPVQGADMTAMAKIDDTRYVVSYRGDSNSYKYALIMTVTGTAISFGTPIVWYNVAQGYQTDILVLDSTRIMATCTSGATVIMTYSGTALTVTSTVSWGSVIGSQDMKPTLVKVNDNTVFMGYGMGTSAPNVYCRMYNLSGNSIMSSTTAVQIATPSPAATNGVCAHLGSGVFVSASAIPDSHMEAKFANVNINCDGIAKTGGTGGQTVQIQSFI